MKKTITLFAAILISASIFATHFTPTGFCTGSAYFKITSFHQGWQFEYKYTDGANTMDSTITGMSDDTLTVLVPQPSSNVAIIVQWRYRQNINDVWREWNYTQSLCGIDAALCYTVMPVKMSNLSATQKDNILTVSFSAGAEDLDHYNIQVSNDATNWKTVQVLKATKAGSYKTVINLMGGTTTALGLLGFAFIGFKEKRRLLALLIAFCCIFYISCSKELTKPDNNVSYKYARVQGVNIDGTVINSNVIKL